MSKLIVGDVETNSINGGPLAGFRNAIINGNFDNWQRGVSGGAGYLADRWVHNVSLTGGSVTQSRQTFALGQTDVPNEPTYFYRVAGSSAVSPFFNVAQKIEDVRTFAGESVTVSFYAKASTARNIRPRFLQFFNGSAAVSTTASPVSLTTSFQKFTATVSIPSIAGKTVGANSRLELTFDIKEGAFGSDLGSDSIDIAQVQLEAGSVATPFERRPVGTELALCQRYFRTAKDVEVTGLTTLGGPVPVREELLISPTMRTAPTASFNYTDNGNMNGAASILTSIDGLRFRTATFTTGTAGARGTFSFLRFDAEL